MMQIAGKWCGVKWGNNARLPSLAGVALWMHKEAMSPTKFVASCGSVFPLPRNSCSRRSKSLISPAMAADENLTFLTQHAKEGALETPEKAMAVRKTSNKMVGQQTKWKYLFVGEEKFHKLVSSRHVHVHAGTWSDDRVARTLNPRADAVRGSTDAAIVTTSNKKMT